MKKVLVILYYWPPSGGVGVQRWIKFIKYLPQFGWMPTVITTQDGDYPAIDTELLKKIPIEIKIIRTKTPTFGNIYRIFSRINKSDIPYGSLEIKSEASLFRKISIWIRLNLVIPDIRIIWNKFAFKAAKIELLSNKYDVVITSGPPHSTHLIGYKLKKKFNVKWIADFRDPWTQMGYLRNVKRWRITSLFDRILEKKVVSKCDFLVAASRKIISDFGNIKKIKLIRNGYDHQDFEDKKKEKTSNEFGINYFGTLPPESNPISAFQAVMLLHKKGIRNIRMNFWGKISADVKKKLEAIDKINVVVFNSYISHEKALNFMVNSSMLLLMINEVKNNQGIITAKIFEYMGSGVTILGIGPENGEAAAILQETETGKMFEYNKIKEIADFIEYHYLVWKSGKKREIKKVTKYNCLDLTKELVKVFDKLIE